MHMSIRTHNLGSTVSTKNVSRLHRLLARTVLTSTSITHSWQLEDSAHGILTILSAFFGAVLHVLHAKSSGLVRLPRCCNLIWDTQVLQHPCCCFGGLTADSALVCIFRRPAAILPDSDGYTPHAAIPVADALHPEL